MLINSAHKIFIIMTFLYIKALIEYFGLLNTIDYILALSLIPQFFLKCRLFMLNACQSTYVIHYYLCTCRILLGSLSSPSHSICIFVLSAVYGQFDLVFSPFLMQCFKYKNWPLFFLTPLKLAYIIFFFYKKVMIQLYTLNFLFDTFFISDPDPNEVLFGSSHIRIRIQQH